MADRPPFDMAMWVFWLVATVILVSVITSAYAAVVCILDAVKTSEKLCSGLQLKDFIGEMLAVVLLLLNYQRRPPGSN